MPEVAEAVADLLGLDEASRELRHQSGQTVLTNRIGWAKTSLVKAGLLEQPAPSSIVITDEGRRVLNSVHGPIDHEYLSRHCPGFASWLADMGQLPAEELDANSGSTVWMLRAGRGGRYAATFIETGLAIVGWSETGDVSGLSREDLEEVVAARFPEMHRNQRGQAVNTLLRVAHTIAEGDLIITPEPATRTILLGKVSGPYRYLDDAIDGGYRHARPVRYRSVPAR